MSNSNYACSAYVVDQAFVEQIAGIELRALVNKLDEVEISRDTFMYEMSCQDPQDFIEATPEQNKEIKELWKKVQQAFEKNSGLTLSIQYHQAEDRGDDIDGGVWEVGNVIEFTPAAKKWKDKIEYKTWTVNG